MDFIFKPGDLARTNVALYDYDFDIVPSNSLVLILEREKREGVDGYWYKGLVHEKIINLFENWLKELNDQI